jgi:hypothetical protein
MLNNPYLSQLDLNSPADGNQVGGGRRVVENMKPGILSAVVLWQRKRKR